MKPFPIADTHPRSGVHSVFYLDKDGKACIARGAGDNGAEVVRFLRQHLWPVTGQIGNRILCVLPGIWPTSIGATV